MTETQKHILEGTIGMYNNCGEMVPAILFSRADLNELEKLNEIKILSNPYGIGDAFFGIVGKSYPIGFTELINFRDLRESLGDNEAARNKCTCIVL